MVTYKLCSEPYHALRWPYHYRLGLRHYLLRCSGKFQWHSKFKVFDTTIQPVATETVSFKKKPCFNNNTNQ